MSARLQTWARVGLILLCAALVWVVAGTLHERVVTTGDKAPDFRITTTSGAQVTPSQFGGRVLVLNFWATWCPPCVQELPSLDQFQRKMASSGVVVVAVSIDKSDKRFQEFLKRHPVSFQLARDPEANISADYGTFKVPETYIIDRTGKVAQKIIGDRNWLDPDLEASIRSIL